MLCLLQVGGLPRAGFWNHVLLDHQGERLRPFVAYSFRQRKLVATTVGSGRLFLYACFCAETQTTLLVFARLQVRVPSVDTTGQRRPKLRRRSALYPSTTARLVGVMWAVALAYQL